MVYAAILGIFGACFCLGFYVPDIFSDRNSFFSSFVGGELLAVLAFTVALTLGGATNIYMFLLGVSDRTGVDFPLAKRGLIRSSLSLIVLFAVAFMLSVFKPIASDALSVWLNAAAMLVVMLNLTILVDITQTAFGLLPSRLIGSEGSDCSMESQAHKTPLN